MQRHDFDPIAFLFGVVFTGFGVLFMTDRVQVLNHAHWLWPGLLVLLGLAVLVGARGRGGARAAQPALQPGSRIDPAVEDELLHSPMTTIDSDLLVDSRTLFTLNQGSRTAQEPATAATEKPTETEETAEAEKAGDGPEGHTTEVIPEVDRDADTELLPPRETRRED